MANMRAIRTRIRSVKNTEQITKAMKMVAVSKLRRTQAGMQSMRPFAEKSQEMLDTLLSSGGKPENRFISPRKEVKKVSYVLFVGNRGLCGVYNNAVFHFAREIIKADERDCELIVVGRWGRDVIAKSGITLKESFAEFSDTPTGDESLTLADYLKELYLDGETDEVHLIYQHYISALRQEPVCEKLLPASPETKGEAKQQFLLEPNAEEVLEGVMQLYINNKVHAVMLESKSGEHSARMTAMTAAADSTKTLISELGLSLNRARQAAITTEISEIVGGAAALENKK